jgi:hypothetical protein
MYSTTSRLTRKRCLFRGRDPCLGTKPKSDEERKGLVYGATQIPSESHVSMLHWPWFWAVVGAEFVIVNIIFW